MAKNGAAIPRSTLAGSSSEKVSAVSALTDKSDGGASPKLRALDTNTQGDCGPQFWQAFRDYMARLCTVSLSDPSEEARFTLTTRRYATPQGVLMRCQGTAFILTRGPALTAQSPDQLLIILQSEGAVETDYAEWRNRRKVGDVEIIDYAQPFRSAATDYAHLAVALPRDSVPATLLSLDPHGLIFRRDGGAARLIGAALQEFYAQADHLTVSEAAAAIDGIVALTTACARARLAADEADHVKLRRKAALEYIDAHLVDTQLGPDEIARAASLSRASLYRLLAAEGGIRAVLLKRRLDHALRLLLTDSKNERSLKEIAKCCGFGGTSQFVRAFRARFGMPPRQYHALVRQQDIDWHEVRLKADGFAQDSLFWQQKPSNGSRWPTGPG